MDNTQAQVIVIGAGIAGLVAAVRLSELGVRTLVLEKGSEDKYPCNTRMAGGAFHVAHRDIEESPQILSDAIMARTRGTIKPEMVQMLANETGRTSKWLKQHGVRFIKVGHEPYRQHTLAPPILTRGRDYWQGRGGDVLLRTLAAELDKAGGRIQRGTLATRLLMKDGACVGVAAIQDGQPVELAAKAVVICDGGFQANHELLREHISPAPEKLKQRNAQSGKGDGLRMAREAGAQLTGMNRFYGHVLAREAMENDDLWPFPMMDFVCAGGLVVDASGKRFMDEGRGGVPMANALAAQQDPLGAIAIFNEDIWNGPGREYLSPANPMLLSGGATMYAAPDIASLAAQVGLPADVLERTVADYNAAVDAGQTEQLTPTRTSTTYKPHPIRKAPFHAVKLCVGITYTMGGIAVDGHARVVDTQDAAIPGLFAAGCAVGGFEGGEHLAYIGGLSRSSVTALCAADEIGRQLGKA